MINSNVTSLDKTFSDKVKNIAKLLNISESTVCLVLYTYLVDCIQDVTINKECNTLFGKLKLNDNNRLTLESDKFGLISLLDKKDIKLIHKICCNGPDYSIF